MALKASGVYDDIAVVHARTGGAAHNVPAFLPWHRYYTWVFERELQRATGSCITVPYWDWERSLESVLGPNTFGSENAGCVTDGIASGWNGDNGCLTRAFNQRISTSRDVEVLSRITNSPTMAEFSAELEGAPHTSIHQYIGGNMATMSSPYGKQKTSALRNSLSDRVMHVCLRLFVLTECLSLDYCDPLSLCRSPLLAPPVSFLPSFILKSVLLDVC
jgi:hypothetical protein